MNSVSYFTPKHLNGQSSISTHMKVRLFHGYLGEYRGTPFGLVICVYARIWRSGMYCDAGTAVSQNISFLCETGTVCGVSTKGRRTSFPKTDQLFLLFVRCSNGIHTHSQKQTRPTKQSAQRSFRNNFAIISQGKLSVQPIAMTRVQIRRSGMAYLNEIIKAFEPRDGRDQVLLQVQAPQLTGRANRGSINAEKFLSGSESTATRKFIQW